VNRIFLIGLAVLSAGLVTRRTGLAIVGGAILAYGWKPEQVSAAFTGVSAEVAAALQTGTAETAPAETMTMAELMEFLREEPATFATY
jgi:hypothetical protein